MPDVRLIDANALMKNIGKIPQLRGITYGRMKKAVEETPTIEAVPAVHGRWVLGVPITCSLCGKPAAQHDSPNSFWMSPYCPWCGQPMDANDTNTPGKPEDCRYYTENSYWGAGCLGTKEIDRCEGEGCKRWKPKQDGGADDGCKDHCNGL